MSHASSGISFASFEGDFDSVGEQPEKIIEINAKERILFVIEWLIGVGLVVKRIESSLMRAYVMDCHQG